MWRSAHRLFAHAIANLVTLALGSATQRLRALFGVAEELTSRENVAFSGVVRAA